MADGIGIKKSTGIVEGEFTSGLVATRKACKLLLPVHQQILCAHSVEISRSCRQRKHTVTRK